MSVATLKDLNALLNARNAERVGYNIAPATGIETIMRGWWITHEQYQESATHLNSFTDASNCKPSAPVETEYITNPSIGRAATFTGLYVHSGCTQSEEAKRLIQSLTRVYSITTNDELFARPAIPTFDNEILNLFGLKESESDTVAIVIYALTKESRAYCMDSISDADLATGLAGAGWTYAGRRFDVDPETNTGRFTMACRKVVNNAFDVNSPDLEWYANKTTKQEQKFRLWIRINNDDALTGLYTPDSGYNVTTVSISPAGEGMLSVQRTQLLEGYGAAEGEDPVVDNGYDTEREQRINPHSLVSGTKYTVVVKNHHLKEKSTAYGTLQASQTGYTLVDTNENEEGGGLWTKEYIYEKTAWTAWATDLVVTNTGYYNVGDDNEVRRRRWIGVQKADKDAAVTACIAGAPGTAIPDSGYEVADVYAQDNGNGSVTIIQTIEKTGGVHYIFHDRYDQDGVYLVRRSMDVVRVSGGVEMMQLAAVSQYGKLYSGTAGTADENAWTWAKTAGVPTGYTRTPLAEVFDPSTGTTITGATLGTVRYVGNDKWEAIRVVYEEI